MPVSKISAVAVNVLGALKSGEKLSAKEINSQFSTKRASDVIRVLRQNGHCIYGNRRANSNEVVYRLGTPSRAMIAAAYGLWFAQSRTN